MTMEEERAIRLARATYRESIETSHAIYYEPAKESVHVVRGRHFVALEHAWGLLGLFEIKRDPLRPYAEELDVDAMDLLIGEAACSDRLRQLLLTLVGRVPLPEGTAGDGFTNYLARRSRP